MATDTGKLYRAVVIILLLMNTFFIGSIWYSLLFNCEGLTGGKATLGILKGKGSGKICPVTGKQL